MKVSKTLQFLTLINFLLASENFINALKDAEIKEAEPLYTTEER